ncbi:MAG: serine/threonine-protein kinase [Pseudomonadota bacterium]|nr:serine/threonine-protein kinase [Pseudomonadota bacterium]
MQHELWARLEQLFAEVTTQRHIDRDAFLARSCGGDTELRRELDELLRAHDAVGVLDSIPRTNDSAPQPSLIAGTALGSWRIDNMIGRGGMGEVYAATRIDAAFEQRAALKLLRFEAVGQLDRFHVERRILARLEHPGIARLLDGGTAPDGRPYTVMEYVAGRSLTDYCRHHSSSLQERLTLFAQVCDAVAFAHRNLVIHRDLKPDNILVDAQGTVKLLDFGIAKLLDAAASAQDTHTTIAPFTPDYAAPEQLSGQPVTTATDIYALGTLLFELLTGERPLRMRGLPSTQAMQLVLDRAAPAPSRTALANADAPLQARLLVGDLDAIVAKCLRKEAAHRYETANALKRDIESHLRNEPVQAREGARLYVLGRALRRYRWALAAVASLIITLAAGLAGTLWQARRAETQARTSAAVQEFVSDLFRANSSSQDDPVKARQTTARELLDLGARKIDTAMADAPAAKLSVLKLLSQLYEDLALYDEAVRLRREAVSRTRQLHGADSTETAGALAELAGAIYASNTIEVSEPEKLLAQAAAILDRKKDFSSKTRGVLLTKLAERYLNVDAPRALDYARQAVRVLETMPPTADLAESLYQRGLLEQNAGLVRDAEASFSRAIVVSRNVDGYPNKNLPRFYAYLGEVQNRLLDIAGAEKSARLAMQMAIAINGEDHVDALQTRMRLGRTLFITGRTQEGLALLLSAKQLALKIRGANDTSHTPVALMDYGYSQAQAGELERGLDDIQKAIALHRSSAGQGSIFMATMLERAAYPLSEMGRYGAAHAYLDEASALRIQARVAPRTSPYNTNTRARIRLALFEGNTQTAQSLLDELFVDADESLGISLTLVERWLLTAEVDLASGRNIPARELAQRARAKIQSSGQGAYHAFYTIRADLVEGAATLQVARPAAALPLLQRTLAVREKLLATASPRIAEAQILLAECHLALGDVTSARSLANAAAAIHALHNELGEHYRRPLRQLQAKLEGK